MIILNIENIENILTNKETRNLLLPGIQPIYDQYLFSQRVPGLKNLKNKSLHDLLYSLNKEHLDKLREFYNEEVKVKTKYSYSVKNVEDITEISSKYNISITKNKDKIGITLWGMINE